jgi:trans-aconitate methyltransferase
MANTWDAKLYNDKHSFVWEKAKGVVDLLAPKSGERILDLGCGTGHLTSEIAAKGARVVGVDRSPEMIAEARKQYPSLKFEVADARRLAFNSEFDAVLSNAALHWIPDAEQVVQGISKALKPGGRFVAEFGGKGNVAHLAAAIARASRALGLERNHEEHPWYYPSLAEYASLLEKHGLEVREAALFDRPTRLEDGEKGLEIWLRMFVGFVLDRLALDRQVAFLRETEKQARADLFKDGIWEIDYRRFRIASWK